MKRITIVLGVVAVMVAMLVALAAPAMAKDNGGNNNGNNNNGGAHNNGGINNRLDNRLDRLDNRVDLDDGNFLVTDFNSSPVFTTNDGIADELCSPLSSDAINNSIPGCIFGDRNDDLNTSFVSDGDFNRVNFDTVDFVNVDRDIDFATGNNHNGDAHHDNGNAQHSGNGNHNGGSGQKGNGK